MLSWFMSPEHDCYLILAGMKAMLFAAGLGTRLKPFTENAPKALAKVGDKTLLQYSLLWLQSFGIFDVVINVHHFADLLEQYLADNLNFGSRITISDERDVLLETGGGLQKAMAHFEGKDPFVALNVDVISTLDINKLMESHKSSGAIATLAVMQRNSSRELLFSAEMALCGWRNNKTGEQKISRELTTYVPRAFSGIQIIDPSIWEDIELTGKFSLIDLYLQVAKNRLIKGFDHTGDEFLDVGKPESIGKAEALMEQYFKK